MFVRRWPKKPLNNFYLFIYSAQELPNQITLEAYESNLATSNSYSIQIKYGLIITDLCAVVNFPVYAGRTLSVCCHTLQFCLNARLILLDRLNYTFHYRLI